MRGGAERLNSRPHRMARMASMSSDRNAKE